MQAVGQERLYHAAPAVKRMQGIKLGGEGGFGLVEQSAQGTGSCSRIEGRDDAPDGMLLHPVAGHITAGDQHRQAGPQVIEHPGADREARLDVEGMEQNPYICLG